MSGLREVESKLQDLLCPDCGTRSISSLSLRCDDPGGACLVVASCRQCGRRFDAETLPTHLERFEAACRLAEREACPRCAGQKRVVRSRCDRWAQQCLFLLACEICGDLRAA